MNRFIGNLMVLLFKYQIRESDWYKDSLRYAKKIGIEEGRVKLYMLHAEDYYSNGSSSRAEE